VNWQTTYPTIAATKEANFTTLNTWIENLPAPETAVEHAVWRRLHLMRDKRAGEEVRRAAPEVADKMNEIRDLLSRVTGVVQAKW